MPNTRPHTPLDGGVCQACKNFDTRKNVNWDERLNELKEICDRHRNKDGTWDCFIPVSGGKDSHAIIYWVKEVMKMNPHCSLPFLSMRYKRYKLMGSIVLM